MKRNIYVHLMEGHQEKGVQLCAKSKKGVQLGISLRSLEEMGVQLVILRKSCASFVTIY